MPGGPLARGGSPYGGPRRGPRAGRRESIVLAGRQIPPPLEAVVGKTIYLPMGKVARVVVAGLDDQPAYRGIEHEVFLSRDKSIFTATFEVESGVAILTPVSIGTAGLGIEADADLGEPFALLTDELTVIVYRPATLIAMYYTVSGTSREYAAQPFGGSINIPLNKTATVRAEGQDEFGNVIVLQDAVWDTLGAITYSIGPANPPDANKRLLTPIALGVPEHVYVSADGDPSPSSVTLTMNSQVVITVPQATHLIESYDLENPPE